MPHTDDRGRPAPFEQAALEELDRLKHELAETRKRRRAANDAFDAFLETFGRSAAARSADRPAGPQPAVTVVPAVAGAHTASAPRLRVTADGGGRAQAPDQEGPPVEAEPRVTRTAHEAFAGPRAGREPLVVPPADPQQVSAHQAGPQGRRFRVPRGAPFVLAAIILAVVVVFIPRGREAGSEGASEDPRGAVPAVVAEPEPEPAPLPPVVPQAAVPAAELVALRRVWVRVTVDGERLLERELEADARVPLAAGEILVVRAGDGGAVRLSIRGEDQGVLGGDGEVVTRTFTAR